MGSMGIIGFVGFPAWRIIVCYWLNHPGKLKLVFCQ